MPERLICVIADTFLVDGRAGLIVVPGLALDDGWLLRIGAKLYTRRPSSAGDPTGACAGGDGSVVGVGGC